MDLQQGSLLFSTFGAVTLAIVVVFLGKRINGWLPLLHRFSIPTPVSGGLFFAIIFYLLESFAGIPVEFDLAARDFLLVYFFTIIGINSNIKEVSKGGKPLLILLFITLIVMLLQNFTGMSIARAFDLHPGTGLIAGTVSLFGGHGTAIAWSPKLSELGVPSGMEMGVACATVGLILAGLMGGPIANFLIKRYQLVPQEKQSQDVGLADKEDDRTMTYSEFLEAILAIHICIFIGRFTQESIEALGGSLPLFVCCLITGLVITSFPIQKIQRLAGKKWPTRTPALALVADVSLGAFLAMSLMSLKLASVIDLAGPLMVILLVQCVITLAAILFLVFPLMGKNYDAAVICAGFGGYSLGSTPIAMANMTSITNQYGGSHLGFLIVPMVCAFFLDLANAVMIPAFLTLL